MTAFFKITSNCPCQIPTPTKTPPASAPAAHAYFRQNSLKSIFIPVPFPSKPFPHGNKPNKKAPLSVSQRGLYCQSISILNTTGLSEQTVLVSITRPSTILFHTGSSSKPSTSTFLMMPWNLGRWDASCYPNDLITTLPSVG